MLFVTRIRIRIYSVSHSRPNTNKNIFIILKWNEYKYSNIFTSNIRISLLLNIQILHGTLVLNFVFPEYQGQNYAIYLCLVFIAKSLFASVHPSVSLSVRPKFFICMVLPELIAHPSLFIWNTTNNSNLLNVTFIIKICIIIIIHSGHKY